MLIILWTKCAWVWIRRGTNKISTMNTFSSGKISPARTWRPKTTFSFRSLVWLTVFCSLYLCLISAKYFICCCYPTCSLWCLLSHSGEKWRLDFSFEQRGVSISSVNDWTPCSSSSRTSVLCSIRIPCLIGVLSNADDCPISLGLFPFVH